MRKFLIESQMKYRVGTMAEADQLEQEFRSNKCYDVKSFKKQKKIVKFKEKVGKETIIEVEEYILCTIVLTFNDEKIPTSLVDLKVDGVTQIKE